MSVSAFKMAVLAAGFFVGLSHQPAWAQSVGEPMPENYSDEAEMPQQTEVYEEPTSRADLGGTASGMIGQDPANLPAPAPAAPQYSDAPPSLPPAFDTVVAPIENTDADVPQFDDPCAAYGDGDAYNMCHDRIKKIERMRDAKNRRMGTEVAPAVIPTEKKVKTDTSADKAKDAVDRVEELEKKLKEKEAAEAARKAAPTTKKGIGDFDRNPAKGTELFK